MISAIADFLHGLVSTIIELPSQFVRMLMSSFDWGFLRWFMGTRGFIITGIIIIALVVYATYTRKDIR